MTYFQKLKDAKDAVTTTLTAKGVKKNHLTFGGEAPAPIKQPRPRTPTDARSEFLANRAMGDWAENILAATLRQTLLEYSVSHFGNTESIAAGHADFRDLYLGGLEEVRKFGKRPDLLLFKKDLKISANLSEKAFKELDHLADSATASIEVRSSKFDALTYMKVRAEQKAAGQKVAKDSPSFTVKVEDLVIVYRWLERKKIPQAYFQVFFDSVFAINVLDIFKLIGQWKKGLVIETPAKNQEKATIMIPITEGVQVGLLTAPPQFTAEHGITKLGRHDAYVKPVGGTLKLNADAVRGVLLKT